MNRLKSSIPSSFPPNTASFGIVLAIGLAFPSGGAGGATAAEPAPQLRAKTATVVISNDFESATALEGWSIAGTIVDLPGDGHALAIERTEARGGAALALLDLPVSKLRGATIRCTARVSAVGVGAKPESWNGIKFMLAIEGPSGKSWPQADLETGSFAWKDAAFRTRIPADATSVRLLLGLEEVSGKVFFDDLRIVLAKPAPASSSERRPSTVSAVPQPRGVPRLRGAMVGPSIDDEGLRILGREWNANLVRWQLIRSATAGRSAAAEDYEAWLEGELRRLDEALPRCERHGLLVVVDLHSPPGGKATAGGYHGSDDRLFTERAMQDSFVAIWRRIALRYAKVKTIWGFDLANEPVETDVAEDCDDWRGLVERAARAVREVDPTRTLIIEAPPWGSPESLADFEPLALENIVYSAHMYLPMSFTHQGVFRPAPEPVDYPGTIDGRRWDRAALEAALRPVVDFQERYGASIYIGEFSVIRWAPEEGARRYLEDLIDIFEAHGWDWSFHAFREWQGWSPEHGIDRTQEERSTTTTVRGRVLREWYAKNRKPRE